MSTRPAPGEPDTLEAAQARVAALPRQAIVVQVPVFDGAAFPEEVAAFIANAVQSRWPAAQARVTLKTREWTAGYDD